MATGRFHLVRRAETAGVFSPTRAAIYEAAE
jgi:hypothetical protein